MPQAEHKPLNGSHIRCSQSLVERFECSGQTSLSQTDENMEKVCQVIHEDGQHKLIMSVTF